MFNTKYYILILLVMILSSCSSNLGSLSLVSSFKNEINYDEYESIGIISGKDTQYMIMGFPTGFPRIDNAVNDALLENDADYLTNAKFSYEKFFFFIYFGIMEYTVTGEGWVKSDNQFKNHEKDLIEEKVVNADQKKRNVFQLPNIKEKTKKNKSNKEIKYDPITGLPINVKKFDPQTGEPIYD